MVARIVGGSVVGWLLGLAPLIVANIILAQSNGTDLSGAALLGLIALGAGVALGGIAAGLIGGHRGAVIAGPIAGLLYAFSLAAALYWLKQHERLPDIIAIHPYRVGGALLFFAAIIAGIAVVVGMLLSLRVSDKDDEAPQLAPQVAQRGNAVSSPMGLSGQERVSQPGYGQYPPYDRREAPATRRVDRDSAPKPRRNSPNSGQNVTHSTSSYPAGYGDSRYDTRYEQQERRPEAPGRW